MTIWVCLLKLAVDICWYLALIGPVCALLPRPAAWALSAVPLAYGAVFLLRRRLHPGRGFNSDVFFWECKILLASVPAEWIFLNSFHWEQSAFWCSLFLLLGVLLLRVCRLGESGQKDRRFWMWNAIHLGAAALVVLLGTSPLVRRILSLAGSALYSGIIVPLLQGIGSVFALVIGGIIQLLSALLPQAELQPLPENFLQIPDTFGEETAEQTGWDLSWMEDILRSAGWFLLAALAALALFFVYKKLTDAPKGGESENAFGIYKSSLPEEKGNPFPQKGGKEARTVRGYYRRFLRLCTKAGMEIGPQQSSGEIQKKAASLWEEDQLSPLRELYLKARYSPEESSKGDAARAREEYRKIKREQP